MLLLPLLASSLLTNGHEIRIVPGIPFVPGPAAAYGPEPLMLLRGQCFQRTQHPFEYSVCPFTNVTQKNVNNDKERWILGVWHRWSYEGGAYDKMQFENGTGEENAHLIVKSNHGSLV